MLLRTLPFLVGIVLVCKCLAADRPDLGLFVRFDSPPSSTFLRDMKRELAEVLPVFSVHWVLQGQTERPSTYRRVVTITFHGSCKASAPATAEPVDDAGVTLGETHTSEGAILPFSEIDCDRVRGFLDAADSNQAGRESRLGRATGRVLAHELYHVLLDTSEHGKKGIAKAVHTPAALLSRSLRFEQGELDLISSRYK